MTAITQVPLSDADAAAVGLAALVVVVMDVGWQVVRHGTVMAHEGAHALAISLLGGRVGRYTPAATQGVAAYAITWLLLLSGVRGIVVRGTASGDGQKLSELTLIPRTIWFLLWLAATLWAVAVGGGWLLQR